MISSVNNGWPTNGATYGISERAWPSALTVLTIMSTCPTAPVCGSLVHPLIMITRFADRA
jgi:hypothetical protein